MQITWGGDDKREKGRDASCHCHVLIPVSVICYLHVYTFFSFNKRRPRFSVTFMNSLFQKNVVITIIVCKKSPCHASSGTGPRAARGCPTPCLLCKIQTTSPAAQGALPTGTGVQVPRATMLASGDPGKYFNLLLFLTRRNYHGWIIISLEYITLSVTVVKNHLCCF